MSPPLPSRWLGIASAACALASTTAAIAIGAPLFLPEQPRLALAPAMPVTVVPAPPVIAPRAVVAPPPHAPCEAHVELAFAVGSTAPAGDLRTLLAPVLTFAHAHADATLIVDGHADPSGDAYQNLLLSKARAHHVALQLSGTGLKQRIVERAFGEFAPTEEPQTDQQRRVRVSIREPHCQEQP